VALATEETVLIPTRNFSDRKPEQDTRKGREPVENFCCQIAACVEIGGPKWNFSAAESFQPVSFQALCKPLQPKLYVPGTSYFGRRNFSSLDGGTFPG
jgi:hypothetical protein